MKYKNIDANATDDNEEIDLAHCGDCGYSGNKGIWKGQKNDNGMIVPVQIITELQANDMWDIEDMSKVDRDNLINGNVKCPICNSKNLY